MDPIPILFIVIMVVGMWFLIIRPQKKRQTEHRKTVESLVPGARVMLASGVYATIASVGEKTVRAEIARGVEIEVLKQAIAEVVPGKDDPAPADPAPEVPTAVDTHDPSALDGASRTDVPETPNDQRSAPGASPHPDPQSDGEPDTPGSDTSKPPTA